MLSSQSSVVLANTLPEDEQITVYTETANLGTEGKVTYQLYYLNKYNLDHLTFVENWIKQRKFYALDLETSGLNALVKKIATIQLGDMLCDNPEVIIIDVRVFSKEELTPILDLIATHGTKLGQNVKFECKFLNSNYGSKLRKVKCTQVTEQIIRAGLFPGKSGASGRGNKAYGDTSMARLCERYLDISIDKGKDVRLSFYDTPPGEHNHRQLVYAAGDVIYPFYIYKQQMKVATDRGLRQTLKIEQDLIPVLAESENRGISFNKAKWIELWQIAVKDRKRTEQALHALYRETVQHEMFEHKADHKMLQANGKPFKFSSSQQVQFFIKSYCEAIDWKYVIVTSKLQLWRLKRKYGQEWLAKRRAKQPNRKFIESDVPDYLIPENYCILVSVEKDELKLARIFGKLPADLVELLLDFGTYSHRETSFGANFLEKISDFDSKLHVEFHQAVPATGRLSAQPNSMNIPRLPAYRKCFIASPGMKFTQADYSQIEPRLSAQVSDEPVYLKAFLEGTDIYCQVGEAMTGNKIVRGTEEGERERQYFKAIVLAMAYRMGPGKLQRQLILALEDDILAGKVEIPTFFEVSDLWKKYLATLEKLVAYQNQCSTHASPLSTQRALLWDEYVGDAVTWITAPCGRKRFFRKESKATYTEAPNAPIQGASATITKLAMVLIQNYIDTSGIDAYMVNAIHDELLYEVEEERAEEFALKQQELMEEAACRYITKVPVKAEFPEGTKGVVDFWMKG